jgi:hypothetical protein
LASVLGFREAFGVLASICHCGDMGQQGYQVRIGTTLEGVQISVLGRQFPDATDWEDGNWLISPVRIGVGRFAGELPAQLRIEELQAFRAGLELIRDTLSGVAELHSMDGWLTLSVQCSASGSLLVSGSADDNPGIGNKLRFEIAGMDQSFLRDLIDQLQEVEHAFPSRKS